VACLLAFQVASLLEECPNSSQGEAVVEEVEQGVTHSLASVSESNQLRLV